MVGTWPPKLHLYLTKYTGHTLTLKHSMQDLAAQRLEALGPTSGSSANESGSEARRAQAEREFLRMEREGPPAGTK